MRLQIGKKTPIKENMEAKWRKLFKKKLNGQRDLVKERQSVFGFGTGTDIIDTVSEELEGQVNEKQEKKEASDVAKKIIKKSV